MIGGGPMPTYIRRPHDDLLRAVLDPAVPASRLVVVRGGSSTGKTRAAYEAVTGQQYHPYWELASVLEHGPSPWSGVAVRNSEARLAAALAALGRLPRRRG